MKKLINRRENIVEEVIQGMVKAYPNKLSRIEGEPIIFRKEKKWGKVALISGGGSGHEPSHAGYVGYGMLDAAVCGEIFTSPGADKVYRAIQEVNTGAGVLLIIKNYSGDVMNFEMAAEMAAMEGITVKQVVVDDDIAVENSTYTVGRRGIAGTVFVHKILGAAAEAGYSLDALVDLGNRLLKNIKTMGMSLKSCMVFSTGKQSFEIGDDEVEIGLGIHGEPGTHREKMTTADQFTEKLFTQIDQEANLKKGEEVAVLVNGLGETTLIELFIINNCLQDLLRKKEVIVAKTLVGNYMTSLDMGGFSITIVKLDQETKELLFAEQDTIAF